MKKALITGVTGQDGSYLADFLLANDYEVWGVVRRSSSFNRARIEHIYMGDNRTSFKLVYGDLSDSSNLAGIISDFKPDEVYNLAAQSHVGISFDMPEYTTDVDGTSTVRLLEIIRKNNPEIKFYQASTSELYGKIQAPIQNEETPFYPRSPYACAKAYSFYITRNYRESYNIFASNGILFNHESPRRGENFVTRKVTLSIARIMQRLQDKLVLGNLDSKRDWGYAPDYVEGMWMILQHDVAEDFVLSTGQTYSVRQFVEKSFAFVGIDIVWDGIGVAERGYDRATGKVIVEVSKDYFRPCEVDLLLGDCSKASRILGWKAKTSFDKLVEIMMQADMEYVKNYTVRY